VEVIVERDKKRLEELEGIIEKNLKSFYEVGKSLLEIQRDKLYLHKNGGEYQTFKAYCRGTWDMGRSNAYELITASKVIDDVSGAPDTPICQTRPLFQLKDNPEQQRIAWARAVETAPGGRVTAAHVAKVVFTASKDIRRGRSSF